MIRSHYVLISVLGCFSFTEVVAQGPDDSINWVGITCPRPIRLYTEIDYHCANLTIAAAEIAFYEFGGNTFESTYDITTGNGNGNGNGGGDQQNTVPTVSVVNYADFNSNGQATASPMTLCLTSDFNVNDGLPNINYITFKTNTVPEKICHWEVTTYDNQIPIEAGGACADGAVTLSTEPGEYYAIHEVADQTFLDNSFGLKITAEYYSGSSGVGIEIFGVRPVAIAENIRLPIGEHVFKYTATDQSGNSAFCEAVVTVLDKEDPVVICPADVTVETDPGQNSNYFLVEKAVFTNDNSVGAGGSLTTYTRFDSHSSNLTTPSHQSIPFPCVGSSTELVYYVVYDESGNNHTCTQSITIVDREPPKVLCPPDITISTVNSQPWGQYLLKYPVVSGDPIISETTPFTSFDGSEITNSFTQGLAFDNSGCVIDNQIIVSAMVNDTSEPVSFSAFNLDSTHIPSTVIAENRMMRFYLHFNSFGEYTGGTAMHPVKLRISDSSGNVAECTRTITVVDNEAPTITCPSEVTVEVEDGFDYAVIQMSTETVDCSINAGSRFGVCDQADNSIFTVNSNTYGELRHQIFYTGDRTMLRSNLKDQVQIEKDTDIRLWLSPSGESNTHVFTRVVYDASNNSAECQFSVVVVDNEDPSFTCPADLIVSTVPGESYSTVVLFNPDDATDNSITVRMGGNGRMNYYDEEALGDEMSSVLPHLRRSDVYPAGNKPGPLTYYRQQPHLQDLHSGLYDPDQRAWRLWIETAAHLDYSITYDSNLVDSGTRLNLSLNSDGTSMNHIITYVVTDASSNDVTCQQQITVIDTEPPVVYCPNTSAVEFTGVTQFDPATNEVHRFYNSFTGNMSCGVDECYNRLVFPTDSGESHATVSLADIEALRNDNSDSLGSLTYEILRADNVITTDQQFNFMGSLQVNSDDRLEFRVTDPSGNSASCYRDVLVVDMERPQITCPPDVHVTLYDGCDDTNALGWADPTASDNVGGAITLTSRYVGVPGPLGLGTDWSDCDNLQHVDSPHWSFPPQRCICAVGTEHFDELQIFLGTTLQYDEAERLAVHGSHRLQQPLLCSDAYQLAVVGAYPDGLSMTSVLNHVQRYCCLPGPHPREVDELDELKPCSNETCYRPGCRICGHNDQDRSINLRSLTLEWSSSTSGSVSISVDTASVTPSSVVDGEIITVEPLVERVLWPCANASFQSSSVFAINGNFANAVAVDTSCSSPLSIGQNIDFTGVGRLTIVGFETIDDDNQNFRNEEDCPLAIAPTKVGRYGEEGGDPHSGYILDECPPGVVLSYLSEGCDENSRNRDKCRCLRNIALKGNISIDCTPAGSSISLIQFAAQFCHGEDAKSDTGAKSSPYPGTDSASDTLYRGGYPFTNTAGQYGGMSDTSWTGTYPFPGAYPYLPEWYGSTTPLVRRPVAGETFYVRYPATVSSNSHVITYTATDSSGNSASCNFTASLEVKCRAIPNMLDSDASWPSAFAGETVTVPCGRCHEGSKTRTCSERGTWLDADVSGCTDDSKDNVAMFEFHFIESTYSGNARDVEEFDQQCETETGCPLNTTEEPYGGRWFEDECKRFEGLEAYLLSQVTEPSRRNILLNSLTSLGLVAKLDVETSRVFKYCSGPFEDPLHNIYIAAVYGSSCTANDLCDQMNLLRDGRFEIDNSDNDTMSIEERLRFIREAGYGLEPGVVLSNLTNFPTCTSQRTFCPNFKWVGQPMNLADENNQIITALNTLSGDSFSCPRLIASVADTDHNSTSTSVHYDDPHTGHTAGSASSANGLFAGILSESTSNEDSVHRQSEGEAHINGKTSGTGQPVAFGKTSGGTGITAGTGMTGGTHSHFHHHHHDYCNSCLGKYHHCDYFNLSSACDGTTALPGSKEMLLACQEICDVVPTCTGWTLQIPDRYSGLCILFNKSLARSDFGIPDHNESPHTGRTRGRSQHQHGRSSSGHSGHHRSAHDPTGLEGVYTGFSFSGAASPANLSLSSCLDLQHEPRPHNEQSARTGMDMSGGYSGSAHHDQSMDIPLTCEDIYGGHGNDPYIYNVTTIDELLSPIPRFDVNLISENLQEANLASDESSVKSSDTAGSGGADESNSDTPEKAEEAGLNEMKNILADIVVAIQQLQLQTTTAATTTTTSSTKPWKITKTKNKSKAKLNSLESITDDESEESNSSKRLQIGTTVAGALLLVGVAIGVAYKWRGGKNERTDVEPNEPIAVVEGESFGTNFQFTKLK